MNTQSDAPMFPQGWLGAMCRYEGAPLALRVRAGVESWAGRSAMPRLFAITLHLAEVRSDGLPVPKYNDSLLDLDMAIIDHFEQESDCLVVLIETFSGKRTWYAYGTNQSTPDRVLANVNTEFAGHRFTSWVKLDPEWGLWELYRSLFQSSVEGN